jgi:hypothetical protein
MDQRFRIAGTHHRPLAACGSHGPRVDGFFIVALYTACYNPSFGVFQLENRRILGFSRPFQR